MRGPAAASRGGSIVFDGIDLRPTSRARELRGKRIAYVAQSAAASFNPAHRLIDQFVETRSAHGVMNAGRGGSAGRSSSSAASPAQSGAASAIAIPHQVSGGQLQRAMAAMAMSCRPDLIVFDEPTTALDVTTQIEVLAAIKDVVRAVQHRRDLHHPRPRGGGADRRPHHGAALRQGGRGGADPRDAVDPQQDYTKSLWAVRSCARHEEAGRAIAPRGRRRRRQPMAATSRCWTTSPSTCRAGAPSRSSANSGSGKSTLARVITGLLPPHRGRGSVRRQAAAARAEASRRKDMLRRIQMIYQMPDTALNPRRASATSSAGRWILSRPPGAARDSARRRAAGA